MKKWGRYHDNSLPLVVALSQLLGDNLDHDVGLQPVIRPQRLLAPLLLLLHLEAGNRHGGCGGDAQIVSRPRPYLDNLLQSRLPLLL